MTGARYTIAGGDAGKDRLDVLQRVHGADTTALLDGVGIPAGGRCLDVGCGGGHVSRELAGRVGPRGSVVGIDMDDVVLARAADDAAAAGVTNVEFRSGDATQLDGPLYDVAYARFLLSHVSDPAKVLTAMAAAVRSGGLVVAEDTDFTGSFCYPPSAPFDRWIALYRETLLRRGGNADVGQRLPSLFEQIGLHDIGVSVCQPCERQGDVKTLNALTIDRIADAVRQEGVASDDEVIELAHAVREYCDDPSTLMSTPRVVQSWGRRA